MKTKSVRNKKLFSNQLKRKCEDELERPSKIINTEIQKNPQQAQLFNGTDISNIYQCLYRSRRSSYPALPKSISEVIELMKKLEDYNHRKRRFNTRCRLYTQYIILLYNFEFEIALFV